MRNKKLFGKLYKYDTRYRSKFMIFPPYSYENYLRKRKKNFTNIT